MRVVGGVSVCAPPPVTLSDDPRRYLPSVKEPPASTSIAALAVSPAILRVTLAVLDRNTTETEERRFG